MIKIPDGVYATGPAVRCIDCEKRRNCDRLRVNKYAKKPCELYSEDLIREAKLNELAAKRKIG